MTAIKERLIGAVTVMDDETASRLWSVIMSDFVPNSWDEIEEEEPDEFDEQMLEDINHNSECKVFTPEPDIKWQ